MKKIFTLIFISLLFLIAPIFANASTVAIDFFYSPTCPHCAKEEIFLNDIQKQYPDLVINRHSVNETENLDKLKEFYARYKVPEQYYGMVPATFTNTKYFIGYNDEIGKNIKTCLDEICLKNGVSQNTSLVDLEGNIGLPIIGKINVKNFSLPALSVILGILDGFNVCSLGALVLILGLVLALKSRKKVLAFGGLFILTTAVIYGILIIAWYKLFSLFIPYMKLMDLLIGALGIGGGIYFFKQYLKYKKYGPNCETTGSKGIVARFSSKFQQSFKDSANTFLLLGSVFIFAAIITIVEFPCSAVIPVAYAGVLAQAKLSSLGYLTYIPIYLLFYMLDEIIVFLIAFFTMKVWLASSKVVTWAALAEALILLSIGAYYLYALI
jgi:thiol-disulfide isomerase/thioredoxin